MLDGAVNKANLTGQHGLYGFCPGVMAAKDYGSGLHLIGQRYIAFCFCDFFYLVFLSEYDFTQIRQFLFLFLGFLLEGGYFRLCLTAGLFGFMEHLLHPLDFRF